MSAFQGNSQTLKKPGFLSRLRARNRSWSKSPAPTPPNANSSHTISSIPSPIGSPSSHASSVANSTGTQQTQVAAAAPQTSTVPTIVLPQGSPSQGGGVTSSNPTGQPSPQASPNQVQSLWDKAISKLKKEERDQLQPLLDSDDYLGVVEETLKIAENAKSFSQRNAWKVQWKGDTIIVRDVAEKFIAWVQNFRAVGDVIVQYDPGHAALPWAGLRFLLQIAVQDQENCGCVLIGIERVAKIICRCRAIEQLYLIPPSSKTQEALKESLLQLYSQILKFLVKSKEFFTQSRGDRLKSSILQTDFHDKYLCVITEAESDVLKVTSILEAETQLEYWEEQKQSFEALRALVGQFEKPIARLDSKIQEISDHLEASRRSDIPEWMSKVDYRAFHNSVQKSIATGTCLWLHNNSKFVSWRNSSTSSIFWLRGSPGCGKTRLTSSVIELILQDREVSGSQEAVAYFYIDKTRERSGTQDGVARAIAKQLATLKPDSPIQPLVVDLYAEREKIGEKSQLLSFDDACKLVAELTSIYPQTTIFVDALDEMNDLDGQWQLVQFLKRLPDDSGGLIKIFLSSRPNEMQLNNLLETSCQHYVTLGDNSSDIEQFINLTIDDLISSRRLLGGKVPSNTRDLIVGSLKEKAQGMFLWVSLQLQGLTRLRSSTEVEKRLHSMPSKLSKLYVDIWDDIFVKGSELEQTIARKAFQWILGAAIVPGPEFLINLIKSQMDVGDLSTDDILSICRNLVIIENEVLGFTHLTVKEFIESTTDFDPQSCKDIVSLETMQLIIEISSLPSGDIGRTILEQEAADKTEKDSLVGFIRHGRPPAEMSIVSMMTASMPTRTPAFYAWVYWPWQIKHSSDRSEKVYSMLSGILGTYSEPGIVFKKIIQSYRSCQNSGNNILICMVIYVMRRGYMRIGSEPGLIDKCVDSEECPLKLATLVPYSRYLECAAEGGLPGGDVIRRHDLLVCSIQADNLAVYRALLSRLRINDLKHRTALRALKCLAERGFREEWEYSLDYLKDKGPSTQLFLSEYLEYSLEYARPYSADDSEVIQAILNRLLNLNLCLRLPDFTGVSARALARCLRDQSVLVLLFKCGFNLNMLVVDTPPPTAVVQTLLQFFVSVDALPSAWPLFFKLGKEQGVDFNKTSEDVQSSSFDNANDRRYSATARWDHMTPLEIILRRLVAVHSDFILCAERALSLRIEGFGESGEALTPSIAMEILKLLLSSGTPAKDPVILQAAYLRDLGISDILEEIMKYRPEAEDIVYKSLQGCLNAIDQRDLTRVAEFVERGGVNINLTLCGQRLSPLARAMENDDYEMVMHLCRFELGPVYEIKLWDSTIHGLAVASGMNKLCDFLEERGLGDYGSSVSTSDSSIYLGGYTQTTTLRANGMQDPPLK
ncbi:hypothetical protein ABW19_dt0208055 [Dactylella cylindrospora]|nr:hypothetical protein ABW19_dt0208055 [Dactylella cylindrospora]